MVSKREALCIFVAAVAGQLGAFQPDLTVTKLGTTCPTPYNISAGGSYDNQGTFTLTGQGHDLYYGWDRGAFAYVEVERDTFEFTARITSGPRNMSNGKYGICVREGLVGNERMINIRYDSYSANRCWTWFFRFTPGGLSSEFCADGSRHGCVKEGRDQSFTEQENVYLRIRKIHPRYYIAMSRDGVDWTDMAVKGTEIRSDTLNWPLLANDEVLFLATKKVYVGLILAGGNQGIPRCELKADKIDLNYADVVAAGPRAAAAEPVQSYAVSATRAGLTLPASLLAKERSVQVEVFSAQGRRQWGGAAAGGGAARFLSFAAPLAPGVYKVVVRSADGRDIPGIGLTTVR